MTQGAVQVVADQTQWQDLYFRHNFDDTGMYPTAGSLSQSPDIIPAGSAPYADPTQLLTDANWATDFGSSTDASAVNYIYLRGENLGQQTTDGQLYLYFSPASLLLYPTNPLDPTKGWANNPLRTSRGAEYVSVSPAAQGRFVTPEPFLWVPEPISGDHYCLVSRVVTKANPNPIPTTGNLNDFARYISEHPNMAWRNVVTRNPDFPTWSTSVEYDQGDVGGDVYVFLRCENAPDGSSVEFSSGTPGPQPPLSKGKTVVQNEVKDGVPTFVATWYGTIPAGYQTNVTYTWYSEGRTPLPDMRITLEALLPVPSDHWDHDLARFAMPLEHFGVSAEEHVGPSHAIRLGSQTMVGLVRPNAAVAAAAAQRPSISLAGLAWEQQRSSVLSHSSTDTTVEIAQVADRGASTQVVTLGEAPPIEDEPVSDLSFDVDLETGPASGDTLVALVTKNVPVGCEVWFTSTSGSIPIEVVPTKVDNPVSFSVATLVDLPQQYAAQLTGYLGLGGRQLDEGWSVQLSAVQVPAEEAEELRTAGVEAMLQGGPKPGILLGAVTVKG